MAAKRKRSNNSNEHMRRQTRRRGHWRDGEDWRFMRSSPTSNTGTAPQTPALASPTRAPRRNEPHTPVEQSPVIGLPAKEALLNDPPNPVLIESTTVLEAPRNEPRTPVPATPVSEAHPEERQSTDAALRSTIEPLQEVPGSVRLCARDVSYAFWISHPVPYLIHRLD